MLVSVRDMLIEGDGMSQFYDKAPEEKVAEAAHLAHEASAVATQLVASLNADEVKACVRKLGELTENRTLGLMLFSISLLVAEMLANAPDPEMIQAVLLVMTQRAMDNRPREMVH